MTWKQKLNCVLLGVVAPLSAGRLVAEEPGVNILSPFTSLDVHRGLYVLNQTFGGRQFWGDVQFFRDWHIQRNVFTGHYRLLNGRDRRYAAGTLRQCQDKLDDLRTRQRLAPMKGRAVILLHGIFRSGHSLRWFGEQLAEEGVLPISMDYPSTQVSLAEAAEYLHQVISRLDGIEEIDLVTHSMGGLVVRAYLAEHADPRLRRMVMIAPPNQGAEFADLLRSNWVYRGVFGPAGQQLVTDGLIDSLPVPAFDFAVIAGARGTPTGWNRLIPGDDDGTVTVASTKLAGAKDFATVPNIHTFLIGDPEVVAMTRQFLDEGRLQAGRAPQPIAAATD